MVFGSHLTSNFQVNWTLNLPRMATCQSVLESSHSSARATVITYHFKAYFKKLVVAYKTVLKPPSYRSIWPATLHLTGYSELGYGRKKRLNRRQVTSDCRSQGRKDNAFSTSSGAEMRPPRNKRLRGQSSNSKILPVPELWCRVYGFIQRSGCQNRKLR